MPKRVTYINKIGAPNSLVALIKKKLSKHIVIQLPDDETHITRIIDRKSVEEICEPELVKENE
jgi:hypothetical protein